jgi:acyl-CoA thioesterase II
MPLPYRAQATLDGELIADSAAAVRVDVFDGPALLWFPRRDVRRTVEDLDRALWQTGVGDREDHIAFDDRRIDLTLVDAGENDDERDITIKRFPTWGDARDLIEVLDVQPDDSGRFQSLARSDWRRPVVEASQILGQAIVAAGRISPGRRAVSASMVFTRPADARASYALELDPIASGRTFDAVTVTASQGRSRLATGTLLLDVTAPDVIRHSVAKPAVAGPYESIPCDMGVTGRDLRVVDGAYTGDPAAAVGPPVLDAWVRFRDLPDDQPIHAGLLAQFSGHMSIAAALRTHEGIGQDEAHRTLSTAINAISLSLHADIRADEWMLYHHDSTFAGDGMTHSECRVYNERGDLLASFTVEAMVRGFAENAAPADYRTSL